jgi:glycosyltransferase involved in cell wall biosynthesis
MCGYNRKLRILWLGHWHSDKALLEYKAVNQAATAWSRGFLGGLSDTGCEIFVCSHCWEQSWPYGQLVPGHSTDFDRSFPVKYARYLNLPGVKDICLKRQYKSMVACSIRDYKPDIVFSYNMYPYHCCVKDVVREAGAAWIPVILDQADPQVDNWSSFQKLSSGASGIVFLSYWGYKNCPLDLPKIHLDGGLVNLVAQANVNMPANIVVYSGKYDDRYGGLDLLFEIFRNIKCPDCKFILTGKDPNNLLKKYLNADKRFEYTGFMNTKDFDEQCQIGSVFINPRPPLVSDNRMAFPSKLLNYLQYGKPVVSTWTDGLSPEYREILLIPETNENLSEDCAQLIDRALSMNRIDRIQLAQKISEWIDVSHTWKRQAARLISWLHNDVKV